MIRNLGILFLLFNSAAALGAPCTNEKLVGTWSLVSIKAEERGAQAFYKRTPFEVMRFGADGTFAYVSSNKPFTVNDAGPRLNAGADPINSYSFTMSEEFLFIYRNRAIFQVFTCILVESSDQDAQPGDVLLTQFPGNPPVRRVQRRL